MIVAALIGIMIAVIVGVNLIGPMNDAIDSIKDSDGAVVDDVTGEMAGLGSAESALLDVLPILFVVVIILGAVAWMGGSDGFKMPSFAWLRRNGKKALGNDEALIARIVKASANWGEYINNLDEYLGVTTRNAWPLSGIMGLHLSEENALTIGRGYDWYLVDKNPERTEFKVVGLHRKNASKNQVYLLGNDGEKPYLNIVPTDYIEADYEECVAHQMVRVKSVEEQEDEGIPVGGVIGAMTAIAIGTVLLPVVKGVVDNAETPPRAHPKAIQK